MQIMVSNFDVVVLSSFLFLSARLVSFRYLTHRSREWPHFAALVLSAPIQPCFRVGLNPAHCSSGFLASFRRRQVNKSIVSLSCPRLTLCHRPPTERPAQSSGYSCSFNSGPTLERGPEPNGPKRKSAPGQEQKRT